MARIKLVYVGGGSSRAAGTMASFVEHGEEFNGSEVVLVDLDADRLAVVRTIAGKLVAERGLDLTVTATTDRRAGLADADAVLTSFRAGDFAARALDERIPVKHGVIGQETQGPGGMFMAFRSLHVIRDIVAEIEAVAPRATIFNYTNPVNIVSQAVCDFTDVPIWSMCEGPIIFPPAVLRAAGLDPARAHVVMAGLNHNCWSFEHTYDGQDLIPLLRTALDDGRPRNDYERRLLHLAVATESVPADYLTYYYFADEILREQQRAPRTRAEVILDELPGYWQHYTEQAKSETPFLDPNRSRGGIHELELAIDVMSAHFNDTGARLPVNLPNNGALPGFDDDTVVEVWSTVDKNGVHPLPQKRLPPVALALTRHLAEYQKLAAYAAWRGTRADGVRAMVANPLVPSLPVAEALYAELALAHARHLPARLLA